jgi:nucleotide-binding universal stress UspA family protein
MYKRVLVPLDGSELAEEALPHAVAQARRFQAELILLRVVEPFAQGRGISLAGMEQIRQQTHAWAHEYLEPIAADIQQEGISVRKVTIDARPHTGIAEFAETNDVDLIVMSTRGQSGLSRWLMGSVADRVVTGAAVPVLLVRATRNASQAPSAESERIGGNTGEVSKP